MTDCSFVNVGGTMHRCTHDGCGRVVDSPFLPGEITARCKSTTARAQEEVARERAVAKADMPSLARKAVNYAKAKLQHEAKGRPLRSENEIELILGKYCRVCPTKRFTGTHCSHKDCGCPMDDPESPSALVLATKGCPDGHFPPDVK